MIEGTTLQNSGIVFSFGQNSPRSTLCTTCVLDPTLTRSELTTEQTYQMQMAIANHYWYLVPHWTRCDVDGSGRSSHLGEGGRSRHIGGEAPRAGVARHAPRRDAGALVHLHAPSLQLRLQRRPYRGSEHDRLGPAAGGGRQVVSLSSHQQTAHLQRLLQLDAQRRRLRASLRPLSGEFLLRVADSLVLRAEQLHDRRFPRGTRRPHHDAHAFPRLFAVHADARRR